MGVAEDFKRATKLLGSKGGVQDKQDLDHLNWAVACFLDCTHSDRSG